MGIGQRMAGSSKNSAAVRKAASNKLYREERDFRADRLIEKWSRVPEVGAGLDKMALGSARNTAIHLDSQAKFMMRLTESQLASAINNFAPENMLRAVRLTMPAVNRSKVFTEFALESMKDSIKYFKPIYTKNAKGTNLMSGRSEKGNFDGERNLDPFDVNWDETDTDFNGDEFQRAIYETSEDRFTQELANGLTVAPGSAEDSYILNRRTVTIPATSEDEVLIVFGKKASQAASPNEFDLGYLDGYVTIFGATERDTIATQNKVTKSFFTNTSDYAGVKIKPAVDSTGNQLVGAFIIDIADCEEAVKTAVLTAKGYGRYDSEADFEGDHLGELELRIASYDFSPRPTSIGVTWSQLSVFSLDASFGASIEEEMLSFASQEIRVAMDKRAFKLAYHNAKTNPKEYTTVFDAGWDPDSPATANQKRGYIENAQTFQTAILKVSDVQLNDIKRGGVSRMAGGPSAISYTTLMKDYDSKGRTSPLGCHQFGELNEIPLFKVPSDIIPTNEILCIWKNDENDADVAIAFGTLVPFFSSGIIQRKNFYSESALATYGDYQVLNKRYLSIIRIKNLKETTDA